jgi:hypothetical protein
MAKKDAPNYRKAESSKESCATCKAWDPNHPDVKQPNTGYCKMYDFVCRGSWTCDAWTSKVKSESYTIPQMRILGKPLPNIKYEDNRP